MKLHLSLTVLVATSERILSDYHPFFTYISTPFSFILFQFHNYVFSYLRERESECNSWFFYHSFIFITYYSFSCFSLSFHWFFVDLVFPFFVYVERHISFCDNWRTTFFSVFCLLQSLVPFIWKFVVNFCLHLFKASIY